MKRALRATVDKNGNLGLISNQHRIPWLKGRTSVRCAVEVVERGVVSIAPLEDWSASHDLQAAEAEALLERSESDPNSDEFLLAFVRDIALKRGYEGAVEKGEYHIRQVRLPEMALFALFEQGTGPLAVGRGRLTGKRGVVHVVIFARRIELWGHPVL